MFVKNNRVTKGLCTLTTFAALALLTACGDSSSNHWEIENNPLEVENQNSVLNQNGSTTNKSSTKKSTFAVPSMVREKTSFAAEGEVIGQVQVDGGGWQDMIMSADGESASFGFTGLQVGSRTIEIRFIHRSESYGDVVIATISETAVIEAGKKTVLDVDEGNYKFPDANKDGIASIDNLKNGISPVNQPAVALPKANGSVAEGESLRLDASDSTDDGSIASYHWELLGDAVLGEIRDADQAIAQFIPANLRVERDDVSIRLTVTDNEGRPVSSELTFKINANNDAPRTEAGENRTAVPGAAIELDGSASFDPDADDAIETYSWKELSNFNVILNDADKAKARFVVPNLPDGSKLRFELSTNDGAVETTDIVEITIDTQNQTPNALITDLDPVEESTLVTLSASQSTDDGGQRFLSFQWEYTGDRDDIVLAQADQVEAAFFAPNTLEDYSLEFKVTVTDAGMLSAEDTTLVTVTADNDAPQTDAGGNRNAAPGEVVTLSGKNSKDPEGGAISYLWEEISDKGLIFDFNDRQNVSFTVPALADMETLQLRLTTSDGELNHSDEVTITIDSLNPAPVCHAGDDQSVAEETTVTLNGSLTTDNDVTSLSYQWKQLGDGPAVTINNANSAEATFSAPNLSDNTELEFELEVIDAGAKSCKATTKVTVEADNDKPTANPGDNRSASQNQLVTLNGNNSSDPENQLLTYSWSEVTDFGIMIDDSESASARFTVPQDLADGTQLVFALTVEDPGKLTDTQQVSISVDSMNPAPVANAGEDSSVAEGAIAKLDGSQSTDETALTYLWEQIDGNAKVTLSDATAAETSFTAPDRAGDTLYTFRLTVTDEGNKKSEDTVNITVEADNDSPTANIVAPMEVSSGSMVSLNGNGSSDPDDGIVFYRWSQPAMQGITLDNTDMANSGFTAPQVESDRMLSFSLEVEDGGMNTASDSVTILVKNNNVAPIANAGEDQTVEEDATVTLDGSASNDTDYNNIVSYLWAQDENDPVKVTLSSTSEVSPTFTAPNLTEPQDFNFTLTVTDGGGLSHSDSVIVSVNGDNDAPVASTPATQRVTGPATVNLDGTSSSDADDGIASYLWSQPEGQNIALADPMAASTSFMLGAAEMGTTLNFTLTVTDASGQTHSAETEVLVVSNNEDPVAVVSQPVQNDIAEGVVVTLDGSMSTDDFDNIVSYLWVQEATDAPTVNLVNAMSTNGIATFMVPNDLFRAESFQFTLTVVDGAGRDHSATAVVNVAGVNERPQAVVADQTLMASFDEVVMLDGRASNDSDDGIKSTVWTITENTTGENINLMASNTARASFTAPLIANEGTVTARLRVTDNADQFSDQTVTITIASGDTLPSVDAGRNQMVDEKTEVTLSGTASDEFGIQEVSWQIDPETAQNYPGLRLNLTNDPNVVTFNAPNLIENDNLFFLFNAVDNINENSVSDRMRVTVRGVNDRPNVTASHMPMTAVKRNETVSLSGEATDPEGENIASYRWNLVNPEGLSISYTGRNTRNATAQIPINIASNVNQLVFELLATDESGAQGRTEVEVDVNPEKLNQTLSFRADIDGDELVKFIGEDKIFTEVATASGPGTNQAITYSSSDNNIATVNNNGRVTITLEPNVLRFAPFADNKASVEIQARKAGNTIYEPVTVSYTLVVSRYQGERAPAPNSIPFTSGPSSYRARTTLDIGVEPSWVSVTDDYLFYQDGTRISLVDIQNQATPQDIFAYQYLGASASLWSVHGEEGNQLYFSTVGSDGFEIKVSDVTNAVGAIIPSRTYDVQDHNLNPVAKTEVFDGKLIFRTPTEIGYFNLSDSPASATPILMDPTPNSDLIPEPRNIVHDDRYVYASFAFLNPDNGTHGFQKWDISGASPQLLGQYYGRNNIFAAKDNYVFMPVTGANDGFEVINVTRQNNFVSAAKIFGDFGTHHYSARDGVEFDKGRLYGVSSQSDTRSVISVYHLDDPEKPVRAGRYEIPFGAEHLHKVGIYSYVIGSENLANFDTDSGVTISRKYDAGQFGRSLEYQISWNTEADLQGASNPTRNIAAWVSDGTTQLSNVDYENRTATVTWNLPSGGQAGNSESHYEIIIAVGNRSFYTTDYDWVKLEP